MSPASKLRKQRKELDKAVFYSYSVSLYVIIFILFTCKL